MSNLSWYLLNGIITPAAAHSLEDLRKQCVIDVHIIALYSVNSFGIPEHLLCAPIAQNYEAYNS